MRPLRCRLTTVCEKACLLSPLDMDADLLVHCAASVYHAGAADIDAPLTQDSTDPLLLCLAIGGMRVGNLFGSTAARIWGSRLALSLSQKTCRQTQWALEGGQASGLKLQILDTTVKKAG
jgi:hypothetical protein